MRIRKHKAVRRVHETTAALCRNSSLVPASAVPAVHGAPPNIICMFAAPN